MNLASLRCILDQIAGEVSEDQTDIDVLIFDDDEYGEIYSVNIEYTDDGKSIVIREYD